ncbi:MAG: hypothetical protein K0S35_3052, partial [Geminicoccaceae bacterium]|nr:hypothetical protein [Geminicoccaceae bacterium]
SLLLSLKQQGRPLPGRRLLHIFGMVQYRTTDGVTTSTSIWLFASKLGAGEGAGATHRQELSG